MSWTGLEWGRSGEYGKRRTGAGGPTIDYVYDEAGQPPTTENRVLSYDARADVSSSVVGSASFGSLYDKDKRLKIRIIESLSRPSESKRIQCAKNRI